jgi:hypothetical protein
VNQPPRAYERVEGWGGGDNGFELGIVSAQATDSRDRVYVVDREPDPGIVIFESDGRFIEKWGGDIFTFPHDICIDERDRLIITDTGDHTVRICSADGTVEKIFGKPEERGAPGKPYNRPSGAWPTSDGEIYVSDGYGQCYVHRLSADGQLLHTWGGQGSGPGQFSLPHNICVTGDDRVIVADREPNHRVCVFHRDGRFLAEWPGHQGVCGVFALDDGTTIITEQGGVSFLDRDGERTLQVPVDDPPFDQPHGPHSVWVDSQGSLYVGEVGLPNLIHKFRPV